MDRRLEIRTAWRRVSNSMVSPDLMTWKQPRVDSLRHTSYATASRSCQLAGTFSWSAVWSFVGRGHNWDPSAPCCEYYLLTLLWVTLWNRAWHTHTHVSFSIIFKVCRLPMYIHTSSFSRFACHPMYPRYLHTSEFSKYVILPRHIHTSH